LRSAPRIAHVVQTIKEGDEIVVAAGTGFGHGHFKDDAGGDAGVLGAPFGGLDGFIVIIESREFRFRMMLGHQNPLYRPHLSPIPISASWNVAPKSTIPLPNNS